MTNQPGQIGVNPVPYNFEKWDEYDQRGQLITNDRIEHVKNLIESVYSSVPDFESYSKDDVDNWVQGQLGGAESSQDAIDSLKTALETHFVAVLRINSGFFEGHTIVIRDVKIDPSNGSTRVDFSGTEPNGKAMEKPQALDHVVNSVIKLLMLEQALEDEINVEKGERFAG